LCPPLELDIVNKIGAEMTKTMHERAKPGRHRTAESRVGNKDTQTYQVKNQVGYLLRRNYQRHLAVFQALACDKQLTSVQFVTLCVIHDDGPSSQVDLINSTGIDQATIRGIIHRLKARKLIKLSADPSDKRKVVASLTDRGGQLLQQMIPCAEAITTETMAPLNPAEREAFLFLLRKLMESGRGGET
jgi:MarR family transcriptional regulator, lower aerobic nicotinate degradation pathway regulator